MAGSRLPASLFTCAPSAPVRDRPARRRPGRSGQFGCLRATEVNTRFGYRDPVHGYDLDYIWHQVDRSLARDMAGIHRVGDSGSIDSIRRSFGARVSQFRSG